MLSITAVVIACLVFLLYEYRIRKPDTIVLYELRGDVRHRKKKVYPKHFSLTISKMVTSVNMKIEAETRGKLDLYISLSLSAVPSLSHLSQLIRIGGWHKEAVKNAAEEMERMVESIIRAFTEKNKIEQLTVENLTKHIESHATTFPEKLGLEIVSINLQTIEPADKEISDAVRRQESARIMEQTEKLKQSARITTSKIKLEADNKIALSEHALNMKKLELKQTQEKKEAELAKKRAQEEADRRLIQLQVDRQELEMLKDNPELLVLTPQAARLAEASQSLRNARTVVNLSGNELNDASPLLGLFHRLLKNSDSANPPDNKDLNPS